MIRFIDRSIFGLPLALTASCPGCPNDEPTAWLKEKIRDVGQSRKVCPRLLRQVARGQTPTGQGGWMRHKW